MDDNTFPYADLKDIIKGVNCPKCENQWLGHHFNEARWCADCGHSFYGNQFCCIGTGTRRRADDAADGRRRAAGRLQQLRAAARQGLPIVMAQGPRGVHHTAFSTQWDEPSTLTLEADYELALREQILRDASQRAQRSIRDKQ